MSRTSCRIRGLVVVGIVLLVTALAHAVAPEVKDDGKFFSADSIKKANEQIADMARKHNVDFLIETYASVPADRIEKVKAMDAAERTAFFRNWAKERAATRVVHGVYALICREPEFFIVGIVGRGEKAFPTGTRAKLEELMRGEFAKKRFDEGLLTGIKFAQERLAKGSTK